MPRRHQRRSAARARRPCARAGVRRRRAGLYAGLHAPGLHRDRSQHDRGAPAGRPGLIETYRRLWPYLWPGTRPDLQRRVFAAFGLLLCAKVVTLAMPFTFKWATDALVAVTGGKDGSGPPPTGLWAAPLAMIALYAVSRIAMSLLTQVRDGLFAKVAMHAVRRLALQTFAHMHRLSYASTSSARPAA